MISKGALSCGCRGVLQCSEVEVLKGGVLRAALELD